MAKSKETGLISDSILQSKDTAQALLNATLDAAFLIDTDGNYLVINETIAKRFGKKPEELKNRSAFDFMSEELARSRKEQVNRVVKTGKPAHFIDNREGIWLEHSIYPIKNQDGKVIRLAVYSRDITERKRIENLLIESEELYRVAIESSNEGFTMVDDKVFVHVNRKFLDIFGYERPDELIGRSIYQVVHPDEIKKAKDIHDKRHRGEPSPMQYDFKGIKKDGTPVYIELTVSTTIYRGRLVSLAFLRDVTERKKIHDELTKYRNSLEIAVQEKTAELIDANTKLQEEVKERKRIQEMLGGILDSIKDFMCILDEDFNIQWLNNTGKTLFGRKAIGRKCYDLLYGRPIKCPTCPAEKTFKDGDVHNHESSFVDANGNPKDVWSTTAVASRHPDGRVKSVLVVSRDVTERKKTREDLEIKSRSLEELNSALKFLLKQREDDKKETEERIAYNVRELVLPYIEKLRTTQLTPAQMAELEIIESNLKEIVSPFMRTMLVKFPKLTPKEIEVVNLIKNGKTTKEISEIMKVSKGAIDLYRNHIRNKLGFVNKKVNLRTFLLSQT